MLHRVMQKPRYRLAAEQIAELINSGELAPGSKLPAEKELCTQLGVSRATVREAMIALEMVGYVETRFGSGTYVAEVLPVYALENERLPEFFELVEARIHVEGVIAALAAKSCDEAMIASLRSLIAKMSDPKAQFADVEAADREFHILLARSTGNSFFVRIVSDFWRVKVSYPEWTRRNKLNGPEDAAGYLASEHAKIVDAIEAGDPEAARDAMQEHCMKYGHQMQMDTATQGSTSQLG